MATMTDDAQETKARKPAKTGWGFGERIGDAALTMIIAVLGLRLAFAFALRADDAARDGVDSQEAAHMSAAVVVAIVMLGFWAVFVAPMFASVLLRPLRAARARAQVTGVGVAAVLTAAIPLVYVGLAHSAFGQVPDSVRTAAWGLTALAALTPILVFFAGKALARARLARVVVLLLALASVIHLVFWLAAS
jgi:hypothetical protein